MTLSTHSQGLCKITAVDGSDLPTTATQVFWDGSVYQEANGTNGFVGAAVRSADSNTWYEEDMICHFWIQERIGGAPEILVATLAGISFPHGLLETQAELGLHDDVADHDPVAGDIIYADATPVWTALAAGVNGTVLTMVAGAPAWAAAAAGGPHTLLNGATHSDTANHAAVKGDIVYASAAGTWNALAIGATQGIMYVNGDVPAWLAAAAGSNVLTTNGGNLAWLAGATGEVEPIVDIQLFEGMIQAKYGDLVATRGVVTTIDDGALADWQNLFSLDDALDEYNADHGGGAGSATKLIHWQPTGAHTDDIVLFTGDCRAYVLRWWGKIAQSAVNCAKDPDSYQGVSHIFASENLPTGSFGAWNTTVRLKLDGTNQLVLEISSGGADNVYIAVRVDVLGITSSDPDDYTDLP